MTDCEMHGYKARVAKSYGIQAEEYQGRTLINKQRSLCPRKKREKEEKKDLQGLVRS